VRYTGKLSSKKLKRIIAVIVVLVIALPAVRGLMQWGFERNSHILNWGYTIKGLDRGFITAEYKIHTITGAKYYISVNGKLYPLRKEFKPEAQNLFTTMPAIKVKLYQAYRIFLVAKFLGITVKIPDRGDTMMVSLTDLDTIDYKLVAKGNIKNLLPENFKSIPAINGTTVYFPGKDSFIKSDYCKITNKVPIKYAANKSASYSKPVSDSGEFVTNLPDGSIFWYPTTFRVNHPLSEIPVIVDGNEMFAISEKGIGILYPVVLAREFGSVPLPVKMGKPIMAKNYTRHLLILYQNGIASLDKTENKFNAVIPLKNGNTVKDLFLENGDIFFSQGEALYRASFNGKVVRVLGSSDINKYLNFHPEKATNSSNQDKDFEVRFVGLGNNYIAMIGYGKKENERIALFLTSKDEISCQGNDFPNPEVCKEGTILGSNILYQRENMAIFGVKRKIGNAYTLKLYIISRVPHIPGKRISIPVYQHIPFKTFSFQSEIESAAIDPHNATLVVICKNGDMYLYKLNA
jgi:hypothetical protein